MIVCRRVALLPYINGIFSQPYVNYDYATGQLCHCHWSAMEKVVKDR